MTFHDYIHSEYEGRARQAVRTLQVWLGTIAPIEPGLKKLTQERLQNIVGYMEWPVEHDDVLNIDIVKER